MTHFLDCECMLVNFLYSWIWRFYISEGDRYLDWRVGFAFLCYSRLPEVSETRGSMILVTNCILWFLFYCILLSAFFGWYSEHTAHIQWTNPCASYTVSERNLRVFHNYNQCCFFRNSVTVCVVKSSIIAVL